MALTTGDPAPEFETTDIRGNAISLREYAGGYLLLSFYRYASCPPCNLRVHELSLRADELKRRGLSLVAVFESPEASLMKHAGKRDIPFPIVADPSGKLYELYSATTSWTGFFAGMFDPKMLKAFARGFLPGRIEGKMSRMPADFLVGPDGGVRRAFYGSTMASHMPVEEILELVSAP